MGIVKQYIGRIPACGIFCGGCPVYIREKKPCPGAEINVERCERCKSFHLCCQSKKINHCHECPSFPCRRLKDFSKRWLKYGQDIIENQIRLKELGESDFSIYFNSQTPEKHNE